MRTDRKCELHAAGVALFDYTSEGIRCDYLAVRKNDNSNYLLQEHTGYTSDILKKCCDKQRTWTG